MSKKNQILVAVANFKLTATDLFEIQNKFGDHIEIITPSEAKEKGIDMDSLPPYPMPKDFKIENIVLPEIIMPFHEHKKQKHSYKQSVKNYNKRFGK